MGIRVHGGHRHGTEDERALRAQIVPTEHFPLNLGLVCGLRMIPLGKGHTDDGGRRWSDKAEAKHQEDRANDAPSERRGGSQENIADSLDDHAAQSNDDDGHMPRSNHDAVEPSLLDAQQRALRAHDVREGSRTDVELVEKE